MAADLGVRVFPQMAVYLMISVSVSLRPSESRRLTRINVLPSDAAVSEFWSLLQHPEEGLQKSKTGTHDESFPREQDWAGAESSHRRTPGRAPFRIQKTSWSSSASVMRHSGVSVDLNSKFRTLQEAHQRGRWQQHLSMARYEKHMPVGTLRGSLHFSELHATTSWTSSGIAPRLISATHSFEGPVRGTAVVWWEWHGTCMSAHGFCSPFLILGQEPNEQGRHPSLPATVRSKR